MNKTNGFSKPRLYNRIGLVGLLSLMSVCPPSARAVDAKIGIKEASALYANKKYVESADAFETLLKTATPNGKLYYYAVLANFYANRKGRARQLSQYVAKVFPGTVEAGYCQKLFPELAGSSPATGGGTAELLKAKQGTQLKTLPPEFLATLPQEVQDGLKTGKMVAVKGEGNTLMVTSRENVADQSTASKINQITGGFSGTSFRGSAPRTKEGSRTVAMAGPGIAMTGVRGGRPFTAADVARDGAGG
ncbi:MAG: hypothetical protein K2Z81_22405, partial [Cyanobacteria bacterium]|nr:hypothetical protein [Cyanobacteriota bacterium]